MPDSSSTAEFLRHLLAAQPQIYAYVRAQFVDRADAEDVYQETVATLWTKFDEFTPGGNFVAWAYAIARFKVLQHRRKAGEKTGFSEQFMELIATESENSTEQVDALQEALAGCLKKLPDADRHVVQHCYSSGTTLAQVAETLGRPLNTIKSVLRRSRLALYECIQRTMKKQGYA